MRDPIWIQRDTDGSIKFTTLRDAQTFDGLEARLSERPLTQERYKGMSLEQIWKRITRKHLDLTLGDWYTLYDFITYRDW
jgi:hypothetical protein